MHEHLSDSHQQELISREAQEREVWLSRYRESRSAEIASKLHDNWRKARLQEDGTYSPRIKQTKDEAWIAAHGTDEVDIANTGYFDLPQDWQEENEAAAKVIYDMIDDFRTRETALSVSVDPSPAGEIVHDAWLDRNQWAEGSELDKPFGELPEPEQVKDIDQVIIGSEELGYTVRPS